jgi:signal transduction histidine kinase
MVMSLGRKLALKLAALVVGLAALAAVTLWGVSGVEVSLRRATAQQEQLRRVYEVGIDVARAREVLAGGQSDAADQAGQRIAAALVKIDALEPAEAIDRPTVEKLRTTLREAMASLRESPDQAEAATPKLNLALNRVSQLAAQAKNRARQLEADGQARRRSTLTLVAALGGLMVIAALVLGVWHYRAIMGPLRRMGEATRSIASGDFGRRVDERGDRELARLAHDFNTMTAELARLYGRLEEEARAKSQELVRSERLASLGLLAAGVAHEINNPLSIMATHAELSARSLEQGEEGAAGDALQTLRVVQDEAFRCKKIIDRLLSMARAEDAPRVLDLARVVGDVVGLLSGLPAYRGPKVVVSMDLTLPLRVKADEAQMKQVLLNLLLNALEATQSPACTSGASCVTISGRRVFDRVELTVRDNGQGMDDDTLKHAFEPFFTRRKGGAGNGLGLWIVQAIVTRHGGSVHASSAGFGKGSVFRVELPAAMEKDDGPEVTPAATGAGLHC